MPFGRLHEEAAGDSKVLALSDAAFRMWACGLIYCQKNLTDGFIPTHAVETFGVRGTAIDRVVDVVLQAAPLPAKAKGVIEGALRSLLTLRHATVATELCTPQVPGKNALWALVEGGYQIHDYLDWNDSREVILEGRAKAKARMRQRREHSGERSREHVGEHIEEHTKEHPSELIEEQPREPVVRGSSGSDLKETRTPHQRYSGGAHEPGSLPRHHIKHAWCDCTFSRCVPQAVHDKLTNQLAPKHGGDRGKASASLLAWYPTIVASLPADAVTGDEFKFWQAHFDASFAAPLASTARKGEPRSTVPDADETKRRMAALRAEAV